MKFTIQGPPVPLARARHSAYKVYDSQKQLKIYHRVELERQVKHKTLQSQPLIMHIRFFMPIPASYSQKKKLEMVGKPHFCKPDSSNLLKWAEDLGTLAGIYYDDAYIYKIDLEKIYDLNPRTEFEIFTVKV